MLRPFISRACAALFGAVLASSGMLLHPASSAPLMPEATNAPGATAPRAEPVIVLLGGRGTGPYVLCPPTATSRTRCDPAREGTGGASAIDAVRTAATAPGVARVVIFLPGYRTGLRDGAAIAARLASVFGPRFVVVLADWGSHGDLVGYHADATMARRSAPALATFLADLHRALPERPLDVFAHSMGARVAAGAMADVPLPAGAEPVVQEAVLAAPDLSLADYRRAIARLPRAFARVTIYVSRADRALALSEVIHLHHRLGQAAPWRRMMADTAVVDASYADRVADGHGYAIHDERVLRDIAAVFAEQPVPHPAWIRTSGVLWKLDPARVPPP